MRALENDSNRPIHGTRHSCEVLIVGAGSMGLAAGYELAKRGHSVILVDEYESPHSYGSHHGDTRILRLAYGEGAGYVPFVKRARELWVQLEEVQSEWTLHQERERLFAQIGVMGILNAGSSMKADIAESVKRYQLPSEELSPEAAMERWPGLRVAEDDVVHFDPLGGVLFSEACLRTYKRGCLHHGGQLIVGRGNRRLSVTQQGVELLWGNDRIAAGQLIIAAGAGAPELLQEWFPEWNIPLQPMRKTVAWFAPTNDTPSQVENGTSGLYAAPAFPAFYQDGPKAMFYGFPDFGEGVKVGRHDGGTPCSRQTVNRDFFADSNDEQELRGFLRKYLPGANGPLNRGTVCLYTLTPDEDFVIDRHPEHAHVLLAAGFSGHGFKFASAVGEALADMVENKAVGEAIPMFRVSRFG